MLMYERGGVSVSLVSVRHVVEQGPEHAPYTNTLYGSSVD